MVEGGWRPPLVVFAVSATVTNYWSQECRLLILQINADMESSTTGENMHIADEIRKMSMCVVKMEWRQQLECVREPWHRYTTKGNRLWTH